MEIDDGSAKEEGERAASAARNLVASTLDIWLVRCAVLVIVALQFLVVNDLTLLPRWVMPSLELALLLPLSIATAWSIGATKKVAAADNPADFSEIVAHHRNMIRNAFLFLTGLVSIANLLSLAGLVQAILGDTREVANRCSSTPSMFGQQILLFSRSGIGISTEGFQRWRPSNRRTSFLRNKHCRPR